jgi:hypothetical protein
VAHSIRTVLGSGGLRAGAQDEQEQLLIRPSRKRQLLALYVDYLVFTAVYQPFAWAVRSTVALDNWLLGLAVFAGLRGVAWALKLWLPGQWALGIRTGPMAMVESRILERERWWTATAGTLLVLEGSKNLVRWTQGLPVEPLLGLAAPQWMAVSAITILGGLNVVAGLLILRTRLAGAVIGIGVLGAEALAAMIHRDDFRQWAREAVIARRGLQGLPLREGEVEMMQMLTATVLPAVIAVGVIWLLVVGARFRHRDRLTGRLGVSS